jgi:hypothetical protein
MFLLNYYFLPVYSLKGVRGLLKPPEEDRKEDWRERGINIIPQNRD